ncbi:MAG: ATPase, T2SS/T4P/T4SS family, partial [Verrucomicrobiae bacterium]|nr:ATPase, T2SS/T4P/T4SS family [Verrucomicrobiae bacterium]
MLDAHNDTVLELLQSRNLITPDQVTEIREEQERSGKTVAQLVLDFQIVDESTLFRIISEHTGYDYMSIEDMNIEPDAIDLVDANTARVNGCLPVLWDGHTLTVALTDPLSVQVLDDLHFATGKHVTMVVVPASQIEKGIERYYGEFGGDGAELDLFSNRLFEDEMQRLGMSELTDIKDIEAEANATPVVKYVNLVMYRAIQARASDIHFEPFADVFRIRYRVDGALLEMAPPPRQMALPVISRIKVMSNLNIAERRLPQDGRIQLNVAGRPVDLRVSCIPTQYGESVVLRVLDRNSTKLELEILGMPRGIYEYISETIQKPNGIFVVTGPTGSGKTTTLYACLNKINTIDAKLLTAEDPVEYEIEGIQQVPVNEAIGLTFAKVLRAFLRQDPDRIMLGEMRDLETAQIAIQASLTGHLVLSTLHTNDAPGAVTRLIDMGVEPFLISSSMEGVLGQRLVRTICKKCRTPYEPNETVLSEIGLTPQEIGDKVFYMGAGCAECNNTGYKGRKGIYELLDINEPIRQQINMRAPSVVIRQKAIELGMRTLREDGLRSIYDGETTIEEVLR